MYDLAVIGAGAAGVAIILNAIDCNNQIKILWIDPTFTGGRLAQCYKNVPSNSKIKTFIDYAEYTNCGREILRKSDNTAAYERMKNLNQQDECILKDAVDILQMIIDGLFQFYKENITIRKGIVEKLALKNEIWSITSCNYEVDNKVCNEVATRYVALCIGSHPKVLNIPLVSLVPLVPLDVILQNEELPIEDSDVIAVFGSSHSAVLVMMNIINASKYKGISVKIVNFYKNDLRYAIYKDDHIMYDNTGLKGIAATWAKKNLEIASDVISRINIDDKELFMSNLRNCNKVVYAVGYEHNKLPIIVINDEKILPMYNSSNGCFEMESNGTSVKGLFGCGIAFPEKITDKYGCELSVGMWKFMKRASQITKWMNLCPESYDFMTHDS